jgi:hypothetical protein
MRPPYLHAEGLASDIHAQTVQCEEVPNADKLRADFVAAQTGRYRPTLYHQEKF